MITVKILCDCGTKFAFDADETLTLARGVINCPNCGADAAAQTNAQLVAARPPAATHPPVAEPARAIRVSIRKPVEVATAEEPVASEGIEPAAPTEPPLRSPFAQRPPLTKSEKQIRLNRELDRRRRPYVPVAMVLLFGLVCFWGWYRFVGSKPKVTMDVQYERPERPIVPRLLGGDELLLVRNRDISLINLLSGEKLWEKSFGNVTNFDDNMPIFSEVSARVERPTPEVRVTSNSFWVIWPDHVLNLTKAEGAPLVSIKLHADEPSILIGEQLLLLEKSPRATNKLAFDIFPLAGGKPQPFEVPLPARDITVELVPDGGSVVAVQWRMIENRIITNKLATGPKVMTASGIEKEVDQNFDKVLNDNLTAGNSLNATVKLVEQLNRRDAAEEPAETYEDRSVYEVELRRVHGGPSTWQGQINGHPSYFPLPTVDVVAGGSSFKVIDKSGKLKWESPLSYPLSREGIDSSQFYNATFHPFGNGRNFDEQDGLRYHFPFVERGDRLYAYDRGVLAAFDLNTGEVKWRVTSVGIRKIIFDQQGALYACSTLDGPQTIMKPNPNRQDDPVQAIVKIETATGRVLWQAPHRGTDLFVSGKFLYSQWVGVNLMDKAAAMGGNSAVIASCAIARIDPGSGDILWQRDYKGDPDTINIRGNQLLIQYPRWIEMVKFFSL